MLGSRRFDKLFWSVLYRWFRISGRNFSKIGISPNSRKKPRKVHFSAVFAILNTRKQFKLILFFLMERIIHYDHFAKEKMKKSWKLDFLRIFKVWNFEFFVNFSIFFVKISIFFVKYASFPTRVVLWFLAVLFWEIFVKKFRSYHQNWKFDKQYFKILHISHFWDFFRKIE